MSAKMSAPRDFRILWAGESVSLLGSQVTLLALPIAAVRILGATPLQMGILQACQFAPFLLVTLLAGVWVDRHHRRPILIVANFSLAFLVALIPAAAAANMLQIGLLYFVAPLVGVFTVFAQVAFSSYVPSLVAAESLVSANTKLEISRNAAQTAGPGLAALLLAVMSAPLTLLFDAISFAVCGTGMLFIRTRESIPTTKVASNVMADIREGLEIAFGNPYLRAMIVVATSFNFFLQALTTLFILYAARDLSMSNAFIGIVFTAESIGGLIGASLAGRAARAFGFGRSVLVMSFFGCTGPLLVPLAHPNTTFMLLFCATGYFIMGFGISAFNVQTISLRQVVAPARALGRVNASARALVFGSIPLGAVAAGVAGNAIGVHTAIIIGAAGSALTWLFIALSPIRNIHACSVSSAMGEALASYAKAS